MRRTMSQIGRLEYEDVDYEPIHVEREEILEPINYEDLIYFVAFLFGILANALVIYCVARYAKMRTKTNLCLLNWSISSCLTLITQIRSYKLISHLFGLVVYNRLLCYTLEYQAIFHVGCSTFMMLLAIDYVVVDRRRLRFAFVFLWSFVATMIVVSTVLCAHHVVVPFSAVLLLCTFFVFLAFTLIKCCTYGSSGGGGDNVTERVKLYLCTCFLLYWLLVWITLAANIINYTNILRGIHVLLILLIYLYPLFNLVLLIAIDRNYMLCLLQLVRCSSQYVEATICYTEDHDPTRAQHDRAAERHDDINNDENSSIDIVISSNNERL